MDGFSSDGYIIDQDRFSEYSYRCMPSSINGCGWIAAYNLRHALGQEVDFNDVRQEMDSMFCMHVPGPTTMRVLLQYINAHIPNCVYSEGHEAAYYNAKDCRAGIFRYHEESVPHFISFVRQADGRYRFFNVADGLEDCIYSMRDFIDERCVRCVIKAVTVKDS